MNEPNFKSEIRDVHGEISQDCLSVKKYIENIMTASQKSSNKRFVEDGFDAFAFFFVHHFGIAKDCETKTIIEVKDKKVLATGVNSNGNLCSIGSFYVPQSNRNAGDLLTAGIDDLTGFFWYSPKNYLVDTFKPSTMILVSNATGIHENTVKNFIQGTEIENSLKVYMRGDYEPLVDGNNDFWTAFFNWLKPCEIVVYDKRKLYPEQKRIEKALWATKKCRCVMPCGTGKLEIIIKLVIRQIKNKKASVIVIIAPRLPLITSNHFPKVAKQLIAYGIQAAYVNLNSAETGENIRTIHDKAGMNLAYMVNTTNPTDLDNAAWAAKNGNRPLIIFATYNSVGRLLQSKVNIDLALFDEAHNLVMGRIPTGDINDAIELSRKSKRKYFFTATEAFTPSPEGRGMQNEDIYGGMVGISPKEAIKLRRIVRPFIQSFIISEARIQKYKDSAAITLDLDDPEIDHNPEFAAICLCESFKEHRKRIKNISYIPDRLGAKLLGVCKNQDVLWAILYSKVLARFKKEHPNVAILAICSDRGAYFYIDGKETLVPAGPSFKDEFMERMYGLGENQDAIILHIAMLGEGIDTPGITGVMPFRDLGDITSVQTTGRAMRLHDEDRRRIDLGEITNESQMVKPKAYIIIPIYSRDSKDTRDRIMKMAKSMRDDLGYMPFENFNSVPLRGKKESITIDEDEIIGDTTEADFITEWEEDDLQEAIENVAERLLKEDSIQQKIRKAVAANVKG